jgi:hypothetical protein
MKNRLAAERTCFKSANRITAEALSPMTVMMVMPVTVPPPVMVPAPVTAMVPAAPVVAMAPVMMMPVPAHFGRHLLPGILLHRRRSARIDQRNSPCALDWSRHHKHRADSRKTQNSRSDHSIPPRMFTPAPCGCPLPATASSRLRWNPEGGDVNDD